MVKAALAHNDLVTAVGRAHSDTQASMQDWHLNSPSNSSHPTTSASPPQPHPSQCLSLLCDVRVRETVVAVLEQSIAHWGRIDIIATCTGHGVIGAAEDQDDYEIHNQFETNFFGTLNILQLSLPYFRQQQGGRYLIFSSTAGALGVPGLGPFCATKYAVEGLIESMLYEVHAFNIKATLVEPGHVRRDEPDSKTHPLPTFGHFSIVPASAPYAGPTAPAGHAKRMVQWLGERQPTSAVKAAELVWQLGHCGFPPLRLLLGSFAVESVRDRLRCVIEEIEDWKHLSFPEGGRAKDSDEGLDEERGFKEEEGADGEDDDADGEGEEDEG